jgi:hypothetical protein
MQGRSANHMLELNTVEEPQRNQQFLRTAAALGCTNSTE